jgi:hypothetical protein
MNGKRSFKVSRLSLLLVIFIFLFLFSKMVLYANAEESKERVIVIKKPKTVKYHLVRIISSYDAVEGDGWYREGEVAKIKAKRIVFVNEDKKSRIVFNSWELDAKGSNTEIEIVIDSPKNILATWRKEYYVLIKDEERKVIEGWFAENTELNIEVPESIDKFFVVKKVFDGWEGSLKGYSRELSIVIKSPIKAEVVRKIDYLYTFLLLYLIALIITLPYVTKKFAKKN